MNIALIIAGGSGQRMNQDIPKQYLNVFDRPVILYTLDAFQQHPDIHAIAVVTLDGWQEILYAYAKQFNITKLKWVTTGGNNGQSSIRNGVFELEKHCAGDDIVLVHDAIRPMLSQDIISNCITECRLHGSAIVTIPCAEAILKKNTENSSDTNVPRETLVRTQTPQAFPLKKLAWAHRAALERGITNSVATCTLMIELGETVYFSAGSEKNIKITTTDDLEIFKSLLSTQKDKWLK